jgi:hypothetical protein
LTAGDGESSVIGRPNRPSPSCSKKTAPSRPRPRSGRTDGAVENTANESSDLTDLDTEDEEVLEEQGVTGEEEEEEEVSTRDLAR